MKTSRKMFRAFTLIELLIVVAIIAILAAIAVPNFLEAQTRSKVSRVYADIRTLNLGIAGYAVDNNAVPFNIYTPEGNNRGRYHDPGTGWNFFGLPWQLTSPVSYLTVGLLKDPFAVGGTQTAGGSFYAAQQHYFYEAAHQEGQYVRSRFYDHYLLPSAEHAPQVLDTKMGYVLWSMGPDRVNGFMVTSYGGYGNQYDATNGTISLGDIGKFAAGGTVIER